MILMIAPNKKVNANGTSRATWSRKVLNTLYSTTRERTLRQKLSVFLPLLGMFHLRLCNLAALRLSAVRQVQKIFFYNELLIIYIWY